MRWLLWLPLVLGLLTIGTAGCGSGHKMTAEQTAHWLVKHRVSPGIHVVCGAGHEGWDYDCILSGDALTGSQAERTYGYDVNDHEVTGFSG